MTSRRGVELRRGKEAMARSVVTSILAGRLTERANSNP
jgi:hypothetical protein